jgi:hypothetical protein
MSDQIEDIDSDFGPALRALVDSGQHWSEPTSFQEYWFFSRWV